MLRICLLALIPAFGLNGLAQAEDISTHVLNISTGTGGAGIPVTLEMKEGDTWTEIGTSTTGENGRVEGFDIETEVATYRLAFDLSNYTDLGQTPFSLKSTSSFRCRMQTGNTMSPFSSAHLDTRPIWGINDTIVRGSTPLTIMM